MNFIKYSIGVIIFAFSISNADAKSAMVNQIPNGSVNSCATCHKSNSNYSFNPFGSVINSGHLVSGKVKWSAALANLDSDGDGYTNGTELQDPAGTWVIGAAAPGDAGKVSNPGVTSSVPTSIQDDEQTLGFSVSSVSPNPFQNSTSINYHLNNSGFLSASIVDINGNIVKNLISEYQFSGSNQLTWDAKDNSGNKVNSGKYFISILLNDKAITKSIVYIK